MIKQYNVIEFNANLDFLAKGMDKEMDELTALKFTAQNIDDGDVKIRAAIKGVFAASLNEKNKSIALSIHANPNVGFIYYEVKNCSVFATTFCNFDWVGDDMILRIYVFESVPPDVDKALLERKVINNGVINLPLWRNVNIIVKKIQECENENETQISV